MFHPGYSPSIFLGIIIINIMVSANHPYLHPEGRSSTGSAQCMGKVPQWLPPEGYAWSHSTAPKPHVFDWESLLEREENWSTRRKTIKSVWDWLKLSPHTIVEEWGTNVEHIANLTSTGTHRDTRIVAHPDIHHTQQDTIYYYYYYHYHYNWLPNIKNFEKQ